MRTREEIEKEGTKTGKGGSGQRRGKEATMGKKCLKVSQEKCSRMHVL